jgi:hypothetical protein
VSAYRRVRSGSPDRSHRSRRSDRSQTAGTYKTYSTYPTYPTYLSDLSSTGIQFYKPLPQAGTPTRRYALNSSNSYCLIGAPLARMDCWARVLGTTGKCSVVTSTRAPTLTLAKSCKMSWERMRMQP